ncbi:MAG: antibiotic biosynthesis monooxygenase [Chitinophagaceae bacterium]|nr:antibiotic biosynthesis monooxygenase [Chitinophagaceae bacterium]
MFKQIDHDRRSFLRNASLLSLSFSLPGFAGEHRKTADDADAPTIEIHTGNKITVLISVFTVQPENEQKLIELFEEGTLSIFSKQPGYISASLHRGVDSKRLVLYGQWESQQYIDAFRKKPEVGQYFQKVKELATVESIVCNDIPFLHHK